jgi:hypothetical protein
MDSIYIIMLNNKPFGYFLDEEELRFHVRSTKQYANSQHPFDFTKNYYWVEEEPQNDSIVKWKCLSNLKNCINPIDTEEYTIEVIQSQLLGGSVVYNIVD